MAVKRSLNLGMPKISTLLLFTVAPLLWGQHGAHTHGKAELSLVLNSDRELVAELIAPAESVYGFEHTPRNAEETKLMNEGLKRLRDALAAMLTFDKKIACDITIEKDNHAETETDHHDHETKSKGHSHGHSDHKSSHKHDHDHDHDHEDKKSSHDHHDHDHHGESHRNVVIQWRLQCKDDLAGRNISVNWNQGLSGIHHMEVTLLTADRQEAFGLKRSGEKVSL